MNTPIHCVPAFATRKPSNYPLNDALGTTMPKTRPNSHEDLIRIVKSLANVTPEHDPLVMFLLVEQARGALEKRNIKI